MGMVVETAKIKMFIDEPVTSVFNFRKIPESGHTPSQASLKEMAWNEERASHRTKYSETLRSEFSTEDNESLYLEVTCQTCAERTEN